MENINRERLVGPGLNQVWRTLHEETYKLFSTYELFTEQHNKRKECMIVGGFA